MIGRLEGCDLRSEKLNIFVPEMIGALTGLKIRPSWPGERV